MGYFQGAHSELFPAVTIAPISELFLSPANWIVPHCHLQHYPLKKPHGKGDQQTIKLSWVYLYLTASPANDQWLLHSGHWQTSEAAVNPNVTLILLSLPLIFNGSHNHSAHQELILWWPVCRQPLALLRKAEVQPNNSVCVLIGALSPRRRLD